MIFTYNITKKGNDMKKSNITKISEYANRADLINDMIRDCRYPGQDGVELFDSRIKFVANQVQMAYNQKQQYNEGNPEYRIKGRNHWDSKAQEIESPDILHQSRWCWIQICKLTTHFYKRRILCRDTEESLPNYC